MKRIIAGLVLLFVLGCAGSIRQPMGTSGFDLGLKYPEINAYISGKMTYQDMSQGTQIAYMKYQKEIEIFKILESSSKISEPQMISYLKMISATELEETIKSDNQIPQNQKNNILKEISKLPTPIDKDIDIVQRPDEYKGKQIAGKLCWDPYSKTWIKQVIIYNDAPVPNRNHPVWGYTSSLTPPAREGSRDWESIDYKLFD